MSLIVLQRGTRMHAQVHILQLEKDHFRRKFNQFPLVFKVRSVTLPLNAHLCFNMPISNAPGLAGMREMSGSWQKGDNTTSRDEQMDIPPLLAFSDFTCPRDVCQKEQRVREF